MPTARWILIAIGFIPALATPHLGDRDPIPAPRLSVDSSDDARAILKTIRAFHPGILLAAWLTSHPEDRVVYDVPDTTAGFPDEVENWCATATPPQLPRRTAYFFVPDWRPDADPPVAEGLPLAHRQCRLGLLMVSLAESDSFAGIARLKPIELALRAALGPPAENERTYVADLDRLRARRTWRLDSIRIAVGYDPTFLRPNRGAIVAVIYAPSAEAARARIHREPGSEAEENAALVVGALVASGFDTALADPLRTVWTTASAWSARQSVGAEPRNLPIDDLAEPLRRWLARLDTLPPPKKAAGLLAADFTMEVAADAFGFGSDEDSSSRLALAQLGVAIRYDQLGASYLYRRNWLTAALQADSTSPVSDYARLRLLAIGYDTAGGCSAGQEAFTVVARDAERLLTRQPPAPLAARAHFLAAAAYRDVVTLASNHSDEYTSPAAYIGKLLESWQKAVQHYAQGWALDPRSILAQSLWSDAWRLAAGLRSHATRFYCIYD